APSAAASTILARSQSRRGTVRERTRAVSTTRSASVRVIGAARRDTITSYRADHTTPAPPPRPRGNHTRSPGHNQAVAGIPESTKISLRQRLAAHAASEWPGISQVSTRYRGRFAYIDATGPDGDNQPLCRLRYVGYANSWGFAIWRASHDDYADSVLIDGTWTGTAEAALDLAAGLYLPDATDHRRTNTEDH
ncbi:hypothetical protein, partial [Parafrankia colletiae]